MIIYSTRTLAIQSFVITSHLSSRCYRFLRLPILAHLRFLSPYKTFERVRHMNPPYCSTSPFLCISSMSNFPPVRGTLQSGVYTIINAHHKTNIVLTNRDQKVMTLVAKSDTSCSEAKVISMCYAYCSIPEIFYVVENHTHFERVLYDS